MVFVVNWLKRDYKLQQLFCGALYNKWKCKKRAVPLEKLTYLSGNNDIKDMSTIGATNTRAQLKKTFSVRKLRIYVIS